METRFGRPGVREGVGPSGGKLYVQRDAGPTTMISKTNFAPS